MSKLPIIIVAMFSTTAFAMGPDPGGHTGAGVTPETTKTGQSAVDAARQTASGGRVENNSPASPTQSDQAGAKGKPAN